MAGIGSSRQDAKRFLRALKGMGIESLVLDAGGVATLSALGREIRRCRSCSLAETRRQVVFGEGNPKARLLFIGEAPGEEEDRQGRPFVGRAGKLLDQMIAATGLGRHDVYIANVLKCRPPNNRDPNPEEIAACRGFLLRQLDLIGPRIICTLGRHAYNTLVERDEQITRVRGRIGQFRGATLLPTYHPSYLLRNEKRMPEALEDMERLKELLR